MEYYKLLQLDREPFSNSSDPDYFFPSGQHLACLQQLELALRLKRGLNVVIGDVGTGKTTLCRQLIRNFSTDPDFESHLILDPSFSTPHEFTKHLFEIICEPTNKGEPLDLEMKEAIKHRLFTKGVDQNKTLVLIIDEGQKITAACVEILRELLNFETNTYKLLQIVIFAQLEFEAVLKAHANFADRINLLHHLQPMNFKDTCKMVQHRLKLAATTARPPKMFTLPAMWAIYRASKGFPRKIIHLCHQSMLAMIIQNRSRAGWALIRSCEKRIGVCHGPALRLLLFGSLAIMSVVIILGYAPEFIARKTDPAPDLTIKRPSAEHAAVIAASPAANAGLRPTPHALPEQAAQPLSLPAPAVETASNARIAQTVAKQEPTGADQSPTTPSSTSPAAVAPVVLGQLAVKPGDTMVALAQKVYGTYRNSYLRALVAANSHIANPNDINIGNVISFPALQTKPKSGICPCWWIILDEKPSLQATMGRFLELTPLLKVPLQLLLFWSPKSGTHYQIAIKGCFANQDEAADVSRMLPSQIAADSNIVSSWPPETIFYSNPAPGRRCDTVKQPNEALN